jgi:glyoxylase-like metal-dependent hydrolase (beta-lactamase superfamily II)
MFVSTRCLFPDFVVTWLLGSDKTKGPVKRLFPQLTPEMLKEYNVGEEVENSISCFLLEAEGKKAIFDTGFNEKISTGIPDRLRELKISPDEIDYVFITHFHPDHIGGLVDKNDQIYFKNAKIYVSKEEYNSWINSPTTDKNKLPQQIMKICEKNVIQFNFEDKLPLGVKPIKAFGHTPGHTVFQKGDFIVIGDLIHGQDVQFKHPEICPFFDDNENDSIESRKNILKYSEDNKLFVAGMHLKYSNCSMFRDFYKNK